MAVSRRSSSSWGLGLFLVAFFAVLFSPAFVSQARADDVQEYGTVIGIVSISAIAATKVEGTGQDRFNFQSNFKC